MTKKELQIYVGMRLRELALCKKTGAPTYNMAAVDARISELKELLKLFGEEN